MISKVLLSRTTKYIYNAIMERIILLSTKPAPTVSTLTASHMIATRYLFKPNFALRAIADVTIISSPSKKLFIHCILAFNFTVPFGTTIKTYFHTAFTLNFLAFSFLLLHIMIAIRSWTPF